MVLAVYKSYNLAVTVKQIDHVQDQSPFSI